VALLETQLPAAAAADEAWLRQKIRTRYAGLEAAPTVEPDDGIRYWAIVRRIRKGLDEAGLYRERLVRVWFPGRDPTEALARARAWVEEQLAKRRPSP
jgi:hypothetical protein